MNILQKQKFHGVFQDQVFYRKSHIDFAPYPQKLFVKVHVTYVSPVNCPFNRASPIYVECQQKNCSSLVKKLF